MEPLYHHPLLVQRCHRLGVHDGVGHSGHAGHGLYVMHADAIGAVLDAPVNDRLEGTAATVAISIANGAACVRVHNVKAMARVAIISDAILNA